MDLPNGKAVTVSHLKQGEDMGGGRPASCTLSGYFATSAGLEYSLALPF